MAPSDWELFFGKGARRPDQASPRPTGPSMSFTDALGLKEQYGPNAILPPDMQAYTLEDLRTKAAARTGIDETTARRWRRKHPAFNRRWIEIVEGCGHCNVDDLVPRAERREIRAHELELRRLEIAARVSPAAEREPERQQEPGEEAAMTPELSGQTASTEIRGK